MTSIIDTKTTVDEAVRKPTLNHCLRSFWKSRVNQDGEKVIYRVLYGGRDSSKSFDAVGNLIAISANRTVKVLATRQFQNNIDESVYSLLKSRIYEFGMEGRFDIQEKWIGCPETGSEFIFKGRARNIDEIKSMNGIDIHFAEECNAMTREEFYILDGTIRKAGSEQWFVFNPKYVHDFIYNKFVLNKHPNSIVRKINYDENPFISEESLIKINTLKTTDPDTYEFEYLGIPKTGGPMVIIKRSWIDAAVDAHIKLGFEPSGEKRIGFDVADKGEDFCANIYAHGSVVLWSDEWKAKEDEQHKSCARTLQNAFVRDANIKYDENGLGVGCGSHFKLINEERKSSVKFSGFNSGGKVMFPERTYDLVSKKKNKDHFSNLKAQTWVAVAERFKNTFECVANPGRKGDFTDDQLISISSSIKNLDKLKTELSTPLEDRDNNGRLKVESKKDLAKRGIPSPNLADAFVMLFSPLLPPMTISNDAIKNFGVPRHR